VDALRVGRVVRALRRRLGWTQEELGERAHVSRSQVSRIEGGGARSMTLRTLDRVAEPLGLQLDLVPRWHGEALDRLLDEGHASLVEALTRRYQAAGGWQLVVEASFSIDGERGSMDLLAFHAGLAVLVVNEVKSAVPDGQATVHVLDRKTRLAPQVAAARGWRAKTVVRLLVINDDRSSRRRVERFGAMFAAAFPLRGRDAGRWIDDPGSALARGPEGVPRSGLLFLASAHEVNGSTGSGGRHRIRRARRKAGADA